MRKEERQRILSILRQGWENDESHDAGGIMRCPVSDFTCTDLLAQEQRIFFRETPLLMGLSSDLPEPNSYWADNASGVSILMVRDADGEFRAFGNVCRHRGARVVAEGRGTATQFSCPFHAWTYSNHGNLIAINRERKFGSICKESHSLIELPCEEKFGMLWVKPSPGGTVNVENCLGGMEDDMSHWDLASKSHGASQVIPAAANWKMAIDTFGENYHFDVLHRDSLAPEIKGNLQTHDIYGLNYRMVFARRNLLESYQSAESPNEVPFRYVTLCVYFIYPNTILLIDHYAVDILRIFPSENSTAKSNTYHSWYVFGDAKHYFEEGPHSYEERFVGFNSVIVNEDYNVASQSQAGAESELYSHIVFGRNEPALHHYHNAHRIGLGRDQLELETA